MSKLQSELLRGLKWVFIAVITVAFMVALWIGSAWFIGWFSEKFYNLQSFGPSNYISFGSSILVFVLLAQIIAIIFTVWGLLSWGKARGVYGKRGINGNK